MHHNPFVGLLEIALESPDAEEYYYREALAASGLFAAFPNVCLQEEFLTLGLWPILLFRDLAVRRSRFTRL